MGLALGLHLMPGVSKLTVDAGYTVCGLRLKTSIFRMLVLTMVCMRFYATRFKIKGITSKFGVNLVWVVRGVGDDRCLAGLPYGWMPPSTHRAAEFGAERTF